MTRILAYSLAAMSLAVAGCSTSSGSNTVSQSQVAPQPVQVFPEQVVSADTYQADPTMDASFGDLINSVRTSAGAPMITYDARLDSAAQGHADDMLANNFFSHTNLSGATVGDRVTAAGYVWTYVGENIGMGQTSEQQVLNGWVGSPSHQANNVNPNFKEFGLGRAGTGADTRWVLVFGTESGS